MRRLMRWISSVLLILALVYGAFWWQNNRPAEPVAKTTVDASYEKSVAWLLASREQVLRDSNPILWWMVGESARIPGDARLQGLYDEFRSAFETQLPRSVWRAFFSPELYRGVDTAPELYRDYA